MTTNLADAFEARAAATPDAPAIVVDDEVGLTYAELDERANRLAQVLVDRGVGAGDRVGVLLANGNEHLEVLLACFKLRALAVNVNTRYLPGEVASLLADAGTRLVVHEPELAASIPAGLDGLARGDDYEAALAAAEPTALAADDRSGADHYVLYTGGTTGRPKGVVWRQGDLRLAALAAADADFVGRRVFVACPLFHGTGQWMALAALLAGGTVVVSRHASVDAVALWDLAGREQVSHLVLVGDAYALPLVEALEADPERWPLDALTVILSGGAPLSTDVAGRLLRALPHLMVVDGYGATETGGHARIVHVAGAAPASAFLVDEDTAVLDDDLRPIAWDDPREGWLARRGPLPLGYEGDHDLTRQTFPIVDGERWAIPGDRARWVARGRLEILGRGSLTVNTGGEKVHVEEVEAVLRTHDGVVDAVVVGAPDDRWGEIVTAVVQAHPGQAPTLDELADHCRAQLAPFKVPRRLVLVDAVRRSASGKPDYRWARSTVGE